jgi:biotin-dependent carboxylase-like uncharacterized protein
MTLRLIEAGLCTLIVDFGRQNYRGLGVPIGGAADRTSLALGNALVGNPPDTPALEIGLLGPTLDSDAPLACVLYGAPFEIHSGRQQPSVGKTFTLHPGERLHIGGTAVGMRAYFCVAGGLQVPRILGSCSSLVPLQAGAALACQPGAIPARFLSKEPPSAAPWLQSEWSIQEVHVVDGPQASWFPGHCLTAPGELTITSASNRMGLRLQGAALPVPARELVSEPVCPGSVQVTRDGQCVILGVDGQTIGGYPKIAQVVSCDLDLLGQLRPGERIVFTPISLEQAEQRHREKQAKLRDALTRIRAAVILSR